MTVYFISWCFSFVVSTILGFVILLRSSRTKPQKLWAAFCFLLSFVSLGFIGAFLSQTENLAVFSIKLINISAILLPAVFFEFVIFFCPSYQTRLYKQISQINYLISFAFALLVMFSGFVIAGAEIKPGLHYWLIAGPLYMPLMIYFTLPFGGGYFLLFRYHSKSTGLLRLQIRYFFTATIIGVIGGFTTFLPAFLPGMYPFGIFFIPTYCLIISYAIVRHKLMDIVVIIRKTIIFAGIVTAAVMAISLPFGLLQAVIGSALGVPNPFIFMALGIVTAVLIYRPVEKTLSELTDKYLFQKKEEIKVILKRLSENIVTILDVDQIGHTILSTLEETLRLESGIIFIHHKDMQNYRILNHFGISSKDLTESIQRLIDNPEIIRFLSEKGKIVNFDQSDPLPREIEDWLKLSKLRVTIPLSIDNDQYGVLALGKKKSDQEFSHEEVDYFPTIETQVSLAIRNARLVEDLIREKEEKMQAKNIAQRVHYAETLGHEMGNKLAMIVLATKNVMERKIPQLKNYHKKYLSDKIPVDLSNAVESIYDHVTKSMAEIKSHTDTIKAITKTAQSHLSSDEETFEEIYVKMVWEDTIKELNLVKGINVQFVGPNDRNFCVHSNAIRLQQVFRNLIKNSLDVMHNDPKAITLECSYQNICDKKVGYFIYTDSGSGIPKEIRDRIFEKGFSTKPKPKGESFMESGSGYGLFMCKDLIENVHQGKLWLDTDYTSGARFIFWIPAKEHAGNRENRITSTADGQEQ